VHIRLTILVVLVLVVLTSCNCSHKAITGKNELSAPEYEVLASWVDAKVTSKELVSKGVGKVVIFNTTSGDPHLQWQDNGRPVPWQKEAESLREEESALQKTATDAFGKANAEQVLLRQPLHCAVECVVVDSAQLEAIFRKGGGDWPAFYKQFPGSTGLLTFSRVGFSADGTQALFYVSGNCGGLCGAGYYVVMERHNEHWMIKKEINVWVS
jgi:hypothetical protein